MAYHPLNLALRFLLELLVLFISGYWAWKTQSGIEKYILVVVLPIAIATIWGVFAVPNDRSRSGKTVVAVSGIIRLGVEFTVFGSGVWFMYKSMNPIYSIMFAGIVIFHYAISHERITWLLKQ
jgi:hypothetical protein